LEIEKFKTAAHKQWYWLIASIESRLPVSKTVLFSNGNPQFVAWLFETLEKFLTVRIRVRFRIEIVPRITAQTK